MVLWCTAIRPREILTIPDALLSDQGKSWGFQKWANHVFWPSMTVRASGHTLPRGRSTFDGIEAQLLYLMPVTRVNVNHDGLRRCSNCRTDKSICSQQRSIAREHIPVYGFGSLSHLLSVKSAECHPWTRDPRRPEEIKTSSNGSFLVQGMAGATNR